MQKRPSATPDWSLAAIAAAIAFAAAAFWPGVEWSPYFIAAAAYLALPPRHRTRANASTIGWSVGFAITILLAFWKAF